MTQNLFISGLAWATTDASLRAFFETIGEVEEATVIIEHDTKRSKGFGFVTYADEADNQKAIDELDGKVLDGREINVAMANSKPARNRHDLF
ncbi:MAG: RNA recognition motif domain-containing protein [Candidatus Saccharimonadales bacterium]